MAQKYRIYINEKVLLITEVVPEHVERYQRIDAQTFDLRSFFEQFDGKAGQALFYLLTPNAKDFLKKVIKNITLIEAAGGVVENEQGEYLFIYRNHKWDLPKGKLEKDEKKKVGAVREVEEECGIKVNSIGKKICVTYHTYKSKGEVILKRTYWYRMTFTGVGELKPQLEEGITKVLWFKREQTAPIVKNTFPSIIDVLVKLELLKDKVEPL